SRLAAAAARRGRRAGRARASVHARLRPRRETVRPQADARPPDQRSARAPPRRLRNCPRLGVRIDARRALGGLLRALALSLRLVGVLLRDRLAFLRARHPRLSLLTETLSLGTPALPAATAAEPAEQEEQE